MTAGQSIITDEHSFFRVHRDVYVSDDVLRSERRLIFDRSWLYAGHVSELGAPGSFLSRTVGGRNVLICRDERDQIGIFLNACSHRGAAVCQAPKGTAKRFSCPYHGWTYDLSGELVARPGDVAYGDTQSRKDFALNRVRHAIYRGLVFLTYDADAASLETHLGAARSYIDLILDQSAAPMEIIPGEFSHAIKANWKLLAENGVDAYHLPFAHQRYLKFIDSLGTAPGSHKRSGKGLSLGNGHAVILSGPPSTGRPIAYWSPLFPERSKPDITRRFEALVERFGQERAERIALFNKSLFIFPNLVINDILGLNLRSFHPVSPGEVAVTVWGAGFADESPEEREARISGLISFIGPGGFGTPDDVEILESCQRAYAHAAIGYSDFSRGLARGTTHHTDEEQNRGFWREWGRHLGVRPQAAENVSAIRRPIAAGAAVAAL